MPSADERREERPVFPGTRRLRVSAAEQRRLRIAEIRLQIHSSQLHEGGDKRRRQQHAASPCQPAKGGDTWKTKQSEKRHGFDDHPRSPALSTPPAVP